MSHTKHNHMGPLVSRLSQVSSAGSSTSASDLSARLAYSQGTRWDAEDFIKVHKLVRESVKHNFESCRIPIPTAIRHDRIIEALGQEAIVKSIGCLAC